MSAAPSMICRYCTETLDGGDVFEVLRERYPDRTDAQIERDARQYGWTKEDPIHFSHEVIIQPDKEPQFTICPACNGINPCASADAPREYFKSSVLPKPSNS